MSSEDSSSKIVDVKDDKSQSTPRSSLIILLVIVGLISLYPYSGISLYFRIVMVLGALSIAFASAIKEEGKRSYDMFKAFGWSFIASGFINLTLVLLGIWFTETDCAGGMGPVAPGNQSCSSYIPNLLLFGNGEVEFIQLAVLFQAIGFFILVIVWAASKYAYDRGAQSAAK